MFRIYDGVVSTANLLAVYSSGFINVADPKKLYGFLYDVGAVAPASITLQISHLTLGETDILIAPD